MDKTKSERAQLQDNIDSMELELRQVQEEIAEVTRQNENVSGKCSCSFTDTSEIDQNPLNHSDSLS